jgi:hypothetical protein
MYRFVFAVISFLRETEASCDALLRSEENASKIAEAQGKIAGCGLLTAKIKKHFLIDDIILESFREKYPCWTDFKMPTLDEFHAELTVIRASEEYKAFVDDIEAENEFKKNWLWMSAEKGRDLIYVRGWKSTMQSFDEVIMQFQTAYTKRKQELQFDAEKKGDDAYEAARETGDADAVPPVIDEEQPAPTEIEDPGKDADCGDNEVPAEEPETSNGNVF